MDRPVSNRISLDRIAIGLSGLCLLHCALTGLLVALLASAGGMLLDPAVHRIGLLLAVMIAAVALGRGVLAHRQAVPAGVGASGLVLMALALAAPHGAPEIALTMIGVAIVAIGHALNRQALRRIAAG